MPGLKDFARKVVAELNKIGDGDEQYHLGASEVTQFSDGEFVPSFTDSVRALRYSSSNHLSSHG